MPRHPRSSEYCERASVLLTMGQQFLQTERGGAGELQGEYFRLGETLQANSQGE